MRRSMKAENMSPLQQAQEKFKPNLKFRLSKVGLEASAKQQVAKPAKIAALQNDAALAAANTKCAAAMPCHWSASAAGMLF